MRPATSALFALIIVAVPLAGHAQPGIPAAPPLAASPQPGIPPAPVAPPVPSSTGELRGEDAVTDAQLLRRTIDSLDAEQRNGGLYVPAPPPDVSPIPDLRTLTPGPGAGVAMPGPGLGAAAPAPSPLPSASPSAGIGTVPESSPVPPSMIGQGSEPPVQDAATGDAEQQQRLLQERQERDLRASRAKAAGQRAADLTADQPQLPLPFVPGMQGEGRMANDDAVGRLSRLIQSQPAPPSVGTPRVVPGQVVGALRMAPPAVVQPIVSDLETRLGLKQIDSAALSSIGTQLVLFEVIGRQTVPGAAAALAGDPRVLLAQPNFVSETTGEHRDAMADLQYGPRMMNVLRAHDRATGKTVRVAVIDTGIDAQHPDLAGRIVQRANFASGNDAGEIHGTALAGIIAATADNGIGIFGVAPDAAIVAVRACAPRAPDQSQGLCTAYALARGLDFAIEQGARVINLSLAGPRDRLMARLIARAHAAGIVVVAAAGNLGPKAAPAYPAALETVIAVTAIDAHAAPYAAASQGAFVSVAAPGVEVLSTVPGGTFAVHTGTSMAAAHVSGVVALLLQAHPNLSPAVVKELLESTARALGPAKPSARVGHGLVDACRALDGAAGGPHSC